MARNKISVAAPPEAVLAVLRNPLRYPDWVVGAKRLRSFDPSWPEPGSEFHHTVGAGPISLDDKTRVLDADPAVRRPEVPGNGRLVLEARAMPAGVAEVSLEVVAVGEPATGSTVVMTERPVRGLAARVHNPLFDALIHLRNTESLRRLRHVVEKA